MQLTHIYRGRAGLRGDSSAELAQAITAARTAGYTVTDIEEDAREPWYGAIILYAGGPNQLTTLRQLVCA